MRALIGIMKRSWVAALVAAIGFIAFQCRKMPIYAASGSSSGSPGADSDNVGSQSYANHCAICHGDKREGILPAFPPLLGINRQMTDQQITDLVHTGKGRMPGFPKLGQEELTALLHFLATSDGTPSSPGGGSSPASSSLSEAGSALFRQNCAFCHGRDAQGGETGPDLTRSKIVRRDRGGDRISEVI